MEDKQEVKDFQVEKDIEVVVAEKTTLSKTFWLVLILLLVIFLSFGVGVIVGRSQGKTLLTTSTTIPSLKVPNITLKKVGLSISNPNGFYSVVELQAENNPYPPDSIEYNQYFEKYACKFSIVRNSSRGEEVSVAERQVDFEDCVGGPMKLVSVSPSGNNFIMSDSGDADQYFVIFSGVKGRHNEFRDQDIYTSDSNPQISWNTDSVSITGNRTSEYQSGVSLRKFNIPLTAL